VGVKGLKNTYYLPFSLLCYLLRLFFVVRPKRLYLLQLFRDGV